MFTKIDLTSSYQQLRIKEEDIPNIAFRTRYIHYIFTVLPFGLTNTPSNFMGLMNNVFSKFFNKFALIFIKDILVYSKTLEEHEKHLEIVIQTICDHQLYAKFSTCEFYQDEI